MIRVRFHGRGGHGIKTAGRIIGTAAFVSGFQVQDSPVYGAERRGAAIAAYTRISEQPIRERGVIDRPDLIVIGDETLLNDPTSGVLAGQARASAVFLDAESPQAAERIARAHAIAAPTIGWNVSGRTREVLGKASALSAGLGAAASRLIGVIPEESLQRAVREELEGLELPPEVIDRNLALACEVFAALPVVELRRQEEPEPSVEPLHQVDYDEVLRGTPSILSPGNAELRHTGAWRIERPEIDLDRCTRCGLCGFRCPDGAIALDDEGYPVIDYDHCKGCMICWQQCPVGAITRKREVRAW